MDALFLCSKNVGIVTNNADLWISSTRENETKLRMGDPVVIEKQLEDGKVYLVRAREYEGLVLARNIGRCSHGTLEKYCFANHFAVAKRYFDLQGCQVRMGSRFPVASKGRNYIECFLPHNVFGMFAVRKEIIEIENMHKGYMEPVCQNVLELARAADGMPYGWGDEGSGIDCSSYVNGIFRCMGIYLPRNVKQLLCLDVPGTDVSQMSMEEVNCVLEKYGVGCLLLTNAHVLIYAGMENGSSMFWHCSNRMGGKCLKSGIGPYEGEFIRVICIL